MFFIKNYVFQKNYISGNFLLFKIPFKTNPETAQTQNVQSNSANTQILKMTFIVIKSCQPSGSPQSSS